MTFPESRILISKYLNKLQSLFVQNLDDWYFVLEIEYRHISATWQKKDEYDMITIGINQYDVSPYYHLFGRKVLFVTKGVRVPIIFDEYVKKFEPATDSHKLLALDSKTAHSKMNNKNIDAYIRANRKSEYDELIKYATLGGVLLIAAGIYGLIDTSIEDKINILIEMVK